MYNYVTLTIFHILYLFTKLFHLEINEVNLTI